MNNRLAEQANYWDTTVHHAKSQGEIIELLDTFGAQGIQITLGRNKGRQAWLVRFAWREAIYRFVFIPLECQYPEKVSSFGGKRQAHSDHAMWQMGRIAVHFVKAILTAADAQPDALFGFMELPQEAGGGQSMTTAEIGVQQLAQTVRLLPESAGSWQVMDGESEVR